MRRVTSADRLRVVIPPCVLVLWLLLVGVAPGSFSDRDLTWLQTVLLSAVLGWVFIGGIVELASTHLSERERLSILWLLRGVFVVPIGISLVWAVQGVVLPVPVRAEGELPNIVALLGQDERGVLRTLGRAEQIGDEDSAARSAAVAPAALTGTRLVVYALPDLEVPDGSGDGTSPEDARARFLQWLGAEPERGYHARVTVYYSPAGRATTAHMDVSRSKAAALLGSGVLEALPARMGLDEGISEAEAPGWATAEYMSGAGGIDRWGRSTRDGRSVGFHLRSNDTTSAEVRSSEAGLVSLTVGEGLLDPLPAAAVVPVAGGTEGETEQDLGLGRGATPGATRDFSDRTFFVVILGTEKSEAAAWRRADVLNERASESGETSPAVTVERSGHLHGLGDDDFWVLVHTVGFDDEREAGRRSRTLSWRLRAMTRTARVKKICGSFTFVSIKPGAVRP